MKKEIAMRHTNTEQNDRLEILLKANNAMNSGKFHGVVAVISPGELIDKITILEIKSKKVIGLDKKSHIDSELSALNELYNKIFSDADQKRVADDIRKQLHDVNSILWGLEELIRELQRTNDFSQKYITTSISITKNNDLRHRLKHAVDQLLNSVIAEQKSHATCSSQPSFFNQNSEKSIEIAYSYCGFKRGFLLDR